MKLVKGQSLTQLLAARSSASEDLPRLLSILQLVCQTLSNVHACGLQADRPVVEFHNRYSASDGIWRRIEWTAKSVPNDNIIFAVARDVTNRVPRHLPCDGRFYNTGRLEQSPTRLLERETARILFSTAYSRLHIQRTAFVWFDTRQQPDNNQTTTRQQPDNNQTAQSSFYKVYAHVQLASV